jgi:iron complex outermembrane receptor protein
VGAFFVLKHKEADGKPVATGGDLAMYEDLNEDGKITVEDRRAFHSPMPTWTFGHTSNFGWRNLDLAMTLRANVGNYVYNNTASQGYYNSLKNAGGLVNLSSAVLKYNFLDPQYYSDVFVEDASFLRLDNITLGYSLPNFRGVDELRVFGTVQNVFTLTGYSGVDPEAGIGGIDNNIYPRSRTFTAGVSIGF